MKKMIAMAALCATSSVFALTENSSVESYFGYKHGIIEVDNTTDRSIALQIKKVTQKGAETNVLLVSANSRESQILYSYNDKLQTLLSGVTCGNREASPENFTFPLELKLSDKDNMPLSQLFTVRKDRNGHVKIRKMAD